jgi:hypothetical protein
MRKITLAFAFVVSMLQLGSSQSVFFELGGPGLASVNFDTRFSGAKQSGIGGRVGVGGFSVGGAGVIFVPVAVNYLLGKDDKHYFELGAGVTPVLGGDGDGDNFSTTFGHLNFGYRLSPPEGGFTFRAFISPVFGEGFFFPYWGGLSFGYKF